MALEANTPSQGLTLDQAFAQLKASRNVETPLDEEQLDGQDADVVDEDLDDEDFNPDDAELDEEESEGDDSEDEAEEGDESEESEEEDVWEIEIEGETVEVTTDELHKGYLRQTDYTRKRQADAAKAKALETEYTGKIDQLAQALKANVSAEERQLQALQQKYTATQDDSAKRNIHYQMLQLQQTIGQRQQAMSQAEALQAQTVQAQQEAYWAEQESKLREQYEDWDTKKDELGNYLKSQGFEDLSMFAHADMASIVDKAKQFDDLQQKRKTVATKKIRRKVPATLKAGQGEKQFNLDRNAIQKAEARFAKTKSIKDAMALQKLKRGK